MNGVYTLVNASPMHGSLRKENDTSTTLRMWRRPLQISPRCRSPIGCGAIWAMAVQSAAVGLVISMPGSGWPVWMPAWSSLMHLMHHARVLQPLASHMWPGMGAADLDAADTYDEAKGQPSI